MKKILFTLLSFISLSLSAQQVSREEMTKIYEEVKSPYKYGMVMPPVDTHHQVDCPTVFREGDKWFMTYVCYNGKDGLSGRGYETWLAESSDLLHWTTLGRVLSYKDSGWDMNQRGGFPSLIDWEWGGSYAMSKYKGNHWMTYLGGEGTGYEGVRAPLYIGQAWTKGDITKAHEWQSLDRPLLHINDKDAQWWEKLIQYKSTIYDDKAKTLGKRFVMFYNAGGINPDNNLKAERIGIALSNDLKKWERYKGNPVFTHEAPGIITGDAQIVRMGDLYVMFYFSAYSPERKYNAFNTFAVSRDLVHWQDWDGPDLVYPTKQYDAMFAHKSCVVKYDGIVYHFYCAVNNDGQRGIALATSKPMGKSPLSFPAPDPKGKRMVMSLNDGWTSKLLAGNTAGKELSWSGNIPHNWDDYYGYRQLKHGNLHGSAVYEKSFDVKKQAGKRYSMCFEGVGSYATLTINGHTWPREAVGRTSWTVDVTDYLRDGKNSISVLCDHPELIMDMPWVCGGCSAEWGFSEGSQPLGIYRPVTLTETDEVRIEPYGVHVWNNAACDSIYIETELKNYGATPVEFELVNNFNQASGKRTFRLTEKVLLKAGESRIVRQLSAIQDAKRWSPVDPYLYKVVTMIKRADVTTDQVETPYGIRNIEWVRTSTDARAPGFYINGERFFINGTCEYEHILGQSHAFSNEQIQSRLKMMRQAGYNAYREGHQPHNMLYQQILDNEGMLFWSQFSAHIWYDTPQFRDNFKRLLRQWIKERRNSPSIILWGIQNESTLPKDFAEECVAIVRELDPTSESMRLTTTCNGGEGTDWNVIQNWSGTYGGSALNYDKELKQPNQLLNGEYGAWRTMGMHSESPLDVLRKEKSYSEERATELMETKLRLAEAARDSVCGHFHWLFLSHDNPGRVQPDGSYRMADKIGPVNYKGLLTVWEQPTDMFYMYRSNYMSAKKDPMVYIVSHTWADRFKSGSRRADITVYSNCDSVLLYNGNQYLGKKRNARKPGTHMLWENRLVEYNIIRAVGYYGGKAVAEDVLLLDGLKTADYDFLTSAERVVPSPADRNAEILKPAEGQNYVARINCGGDSYTDSYGNLWQGDSPRLSSSWGKLQGYSDAQASQTRINEPIRGTKDWELFRSVRYGRHQLVYDLPLPDGEYNVELYFAEPWLGLGGGVSTDCEGERLFSVAIGGEIKVKDLDVWAEAGHAGALKRVVKGVAKDGHLVISFPEVKVGQAVISAIAVSTMARLAPIPDFSEPEYWKHITEDKVEKFPSELLPADAEAFPATRYEPLPSKQKAKKGQLSYVSEWQITPGVGREYALRFRYKNTGEPQTAILRVIDQKGSVLVDREMRFPTTPNKFRIISTTTGTQINAGNYRLQLLQPGSKKPLEGIEFEYLEVQ